MRAIGLTFLFVALTSYAAFGEVVLFADYSDPDVIRVGDDYYLTASSFANVPGLPILHSKDLRNWSLVGYAIKRLPAELDQPQHGKGVWAPSLRSEERRVGKECRSRWSPYH